MKSDKRRAYERPIAQVLDVSLEDALMSSDGNYTEWDPQALEIDNYK